MKFIGIRKLYKPRIGNFRALNQILNEFHFLETVKLSTTSSSERATTSRDNVVLFHMIPFKFGLRLILPRFI